MLTYCLVCKIDTENKGAKMIKTKNSRVILSSKCAVCGNKKSRFIKEQEESRILSSVGIRIPLSKIPVLRNIVF